MLEVQIKAVKLRFFDWLCFWSRKKKPVLSLKVSNHKEYTMAYNGLINDEFEISGCNEKYYYRRISNSIPFVYNYGAFKGQVLLFRIYSKMFRRYIEIDGQSYILGKFLKNKEYHFPFPYDWFGTYNLARYPESFEAEGLMITGYKLIRGKGQG